MVVMVHLYQVFQHIDQLDHDLFHVFDVYVLYNHENSIKEKLLFFRKHTTPVYKFLSFITFLMHDKLCKFLTMSLDIDYLQFEQMKCCRVMIYYMNYSLVFNTSRRKNKQHRVLFDS